MSRKTEMPPVAGCKGTALYPKKPGKFVHLFDTHDWRYSSQWNGNSRDVLPFWEGSTGISRSGWRCYDCGKFVWDLTDLEFAASVAIYSGIIKLPKCTPVDQGKLET